MDRRLTDRPASRATSAADAAKARIRPAAHADLEAIRALLRTTWHDTYDPLIGPERIEALTATWHTPQNLGRLIEDAAATYLVAEDRDGGDIVGVAGARLDDGRILQIRQLYVRPDRQRAGIGRALLARLLKAAPSAVEACLSVEAGNAKGVAFYRRNAFDILDEVEEDGMATLRMTRRLGEDLAR